MEILIKPLVTEKMTIQGEKLNRYGFIVDRRANKIEIKAAVEKQYGVTVSDVNTVNYHGKRKSRYTERKNPTLYEGLSKNKHRLSRTVCMACNPAKWFIRSHLQR